ncbi:hypothetical protein [Tardiphaga sp. 862_B3_N1_1]|uniref:hypothetical protein n=1 Tax=Tardiphaga sp. 862_B3_N1_1 TaxID=3240763 RepID=UPI003F89D885
MTHTTEKARELWCPMIRVGVLPSGGGPAAVNDPSVEYRGNCIADQCAMWRSVPSTTTHKERRVHENPGGTPQFYEQIIDVPDEPTHGYCGLAGSPVAAQPSP